MSTLADRVKQNEGFRNKIYKDTLGFATIGYGHKVVEGDPFEEGVEYPKEQLEEVFKTYNPTTVYTCNSTDTNQDHQAVFNATMIVCRPHCTRVKRLLSYEVPSSTDQMPKAHSEFRPNFYNALNHMHVLQKTMAMKKYKSELRNYPSPRSLEGIETYCKFRGLEISEPFAEAFMLLREIK